MSKKERSETLKRSSYSQDAVLPREAARTKLAAAGALSTIWKASPDLEMPSDDELIELGTLPPGSPSILDMINEDRGDR